MNEYTTADYLNQLEQDREDLVDNLETKGITGLTGDETFTELVTEVLNISSGSASDFMGNTINTGSNSYNRLGNIIKVLPNNIVAGSTNLNYAFNDCTLLEEIPYFDTSNVTSMDYMCNNCYSLKTFPLIDTSNITSNGYAMFFNCKSLTSIPLLDTSNFTNFSSMFAGCEELVSIPQLDTGKVTNFNGCFQTCKKLANLPLLDTSSVTGTASFNNFFNRYCTSLTNDSLNNLLKMLANATGYTGTKTLRQIFGNFGMYDYYPSSTIQSLSNYTDFINAGWTIGW